MRSLYNDLESVMDRLETRWHKFNYSTDVFAEIAYEETHSFDFSELGEIRNQMKLLDMPGVRIQQAPSTFSDLYLQIFHNGRFMVEILNWWGGHVNVHDHDFSAVQFQLKGDALNAEYDFKTSREEGALRFGELKLQTAEVWKQGNTSLVHAGKDHAHSVFHLGEPTTSLLVRTTATARYGAQSNYFPTLAAHYHVSNTIQRKKLTALSLLGRGSEKCFRETYSHFLNKQSLSENFFMMTKLGEILFEESYVDLIAEFASRGEDEAAVVKSVIANNGIDFFKTRVNDIEGLSQQERLAGFTVAAAHDLANFKSIEQSPKMADYRHGLRPGLKSFLAKMSADDKSTAVRYLETFGLNELINEKV